MSPPPSRQLSAAEFRKRGYLQEVNRRFLHPLGLAMFIDKDPDTGEESLGGVYDCQDEAEGVYYGWPAGSDGARIMGERAREVEAEWAARSHPRTEKLGFMVQPVEADPLAGLDTEVSL